RRWVTGSLWQRLATTQFHPTKSGDFVGTPESARRSRAYPLRLTKPDLIGTSRSATGCRPMAGSAVARAPEHEDLGWLATLEDPHRPLQLPRAGGFRQGGFEQPQLVGDNHEAGTVCGQPSGLTQQRRVKRDVLAVGADRVPVGKVGAEGCVPRHVQAGQRAV